MHWSESSLENTKTKRPVHNRRCTGERATILSDGRQKPLDCWPQDCSSAGPAKDQFQRYSRGKSWTVLLPLTLRPHLFSRFSCVLLARRKACNQWRPRSTGTSFPRSLSALLV